METYIIRVNGVTYEVEVEKKGETPAQETPQPQNPAAAQSSTPVKGQPVTAGTAGKVWRIEAKPGDVLKKGDAILILEAMKMEIPVVAPADGRLETITAAEGDAVEAGQTIATIA